MKRNVRGFAVRQICHGVQAPDATGPALGGSMDVTACSDRTLASKATSRHLMRRVQQAPPSELVAGRDGYEELQLQIRTTNHTGTSGVQGVAEKKRNDG